MKVTLEDMQNWLHECQRTNCTHMLLGIDRSDGEFEIFPVKVTPKDKLEDVINFYNQQDGVKVLEIYDMSVSIEEQLKENIYVTSNR